MTAKTALITGAAKRIGKEIALSLAKQNYNIILHYNRSNEEAKSLKHEIENIGVHCTLKQANFLIEEEVKEMMSDVIPDLLVNNASIFINDKLHDVTYVNLEQHMKVNVLAPIILSNIMYEKNQLLNRKGNIINMLDYCILKTPSNFYSYAMSKKCLWETTQLMASSMAPLIRVNALALNHVLKPSNQSEENFIASKQSSPLQLAPNIDELSKTIEFITTTPSITGQVLFLDGGKHLNIPHPL
jgi:NAD(P)-dependent dehydrogenase (short-subunit alcohol dehydrogenase family)